VRDIVDPPLMQELLRLTQGPVSGGNYAPIHSVCQAGKMRRWADCLRRLHRRRNGEDPCRDPLRADAAGHAIEFVEVRDTSSEVVW